MPDEVVPQATPANAEPAAPAPAEENAVKPAEGGESAPSETQTDLNADAANTGNKGAEPADEPKVKLSELIAQRKRAQEAEKRAAYLEGKLEGSQPQAPAAHPKAEKEPALDEFDGPTAYEDWIVALGLYRGEQKQKTQRAQEETQTQAASVKQKWSERCQQAVNDIPDLEEVLNSHVQPFPILHPMIEDAILKSELGPQIVYYLHKNPTEGKRLAQMDPTLAIMELVGVREKAKVALQPKIKKATSAAPPLNPGNGGGTTVDTDLADLPMEEYLKRREEQTYVKVGGKLVPQ